MDLKRFIRDVPDFPKPGILFKDITPLLGDGKAFSMAIESLAAHYRTARVEAIAGIESRRLVYAGGIALWMSLSIYSGGFYLTVMMSVALAVFCTASAMMRRDSPPLLLLAGEFDPKFTDLAFAAVARCPDAEAVVLRGRGHALVEEDPEAVAREIAGFLAAG